MSFYFENAKDPGEKIVLTFDFSAELAAGETITSVSAVAITSAQDASPSGVLNGAASIGADNASVLQPVQAGVAGASYAIKVTAATSNALKVLAMTGILAVAAGA